MALKKKGEGGKPTVYLEFRGKLGAFEQYKGKDANDHPIYEHYAEIEGHLTGFRPHQKTIKVPGQGESVLRQLHLYFEDHNHPEDPRVRVSVDVDTYQGIKVLGHLNAADLSLPLRFRVGMIKQGESLGDDGAKADKDIVFQTWHQGDKRLVPDYGDGKTDFDVPKVKVGQGKMMTNWADEGHEAFMSGLVERTMERLKALTEPAQGQGQGQSDAPPPEEEGISAADVASAMENAERPRVSA